MRNVEDTLCDVQGVLLARLVKPYKEESDHDISTELLKEIEQHLVDYALICKRVREFQQMVEEIANGL